MASLLFKFVNFFLLLFILYWFARKPFKNYLLRRREEIKERLELAEKRLKEAEELKMLYEERLRMLDTEIEELKRNTAKEIEQEKLRLKREAEEYIEGLKNQIALTRAQELKEMEERIKRQLVELTVERVETLLRERIQKEDHKRLVKEFAEYLRGIN